MRDATRKDVVVARSGTLGSVSGLLPLLFGSLLVALLAIAAGPSSGGWFFQSPVSPVAPGPAGSPVSPVAPEPAASPVVPEETVTAPALVSVRVPPNFIPWIIGIVVAGAVVGVALMWKRDKGRGGDNA